MKKLSGVLLESFSGASLVNAGLSSAIQTVLDAATVDRWDFCRDLMLMMPLA